MNAILKTAKQTVIAWSATIFTLMFCLFSLLEVDARGYIIKVKDEVTEKKVDYLEQIYFSGENKAGLSVKILVALQKMGNSSPTKSLARQLTFLAEIQDNANNAEDACDILDMLAVGIYQIDAIEAEKQGVKMPSGKAKAKAGDALATLSKLNSSANGVSSSASDLAWSSYLLSGGKSSSFTSGAGKVAGTASVIGSVSGSMGKAAEAGKKIGELSKSIFTKKDKSCNDVTKKEIEIGTHGAPDASAPSEVNTDPAATVNKTVNSNLSASNTVINIPGISTAALRSITDSLKTKAGVYSAEKAYNEALSTITVVHSGKTDTLADWLEDKFGNKFKLVNYGDGKINLAPKPNK